MKPERHLYRNFYWKVNTEWIKKEILKLYLSDLLPTHPTFINNMERELIVSKNFSNYGTLGYTFYGLDGSPPKGCAIYQADSLTLIILGIWGGKILYKNIIVEGVNKEEREDEKNT